MPFTSPELEELFYYGKVLLTRLPKTGDDEGEVDISDAAVLTHLRTQIIGEHNGYVFDEQFAGVLIDRQSANDDLVPDVFDKAEFKEALTSWARREVYRRIQDGLGGAACAGGTTSYVAVPAITTRRRRRSATAPNRPSRRRAR